MPSARRLLAGGAALAAAAVVGGAGCGGGTGSAGGDAGPPGGTGTAPGAAAAPTPRLGGTPAGPALVVRAWTDAERASRVREAAALFALPATVQLEPGGPEVRLTRRRELVAFNDALPCGAVLLRTVPHGPYVFALFRLVSRPGVTCDGPGATARAAFLIRGDRIVEWRRLPDRPGDQNVPSVDPHQDLQET